MTIAEFLLARIAEDEEIARTAADHRTSVSSQPEMASFLSSQGRAGERWTRKYDTVNATHEDGQRAGGIAYVGNFGMSLVEHIARHDPARVLAECEAKRRIIGFHESWPVLVSQPPSFDRVESDDVQSLTFRASQRIAWATEQEYRAKFGDEPPTAPMLLALALVYADHPDFDPAWRAE